MAGKYVGKITGGKEVCISRNSPNEHVVITGISGSGKSVRIADIERHIIKNGGTVLAFDINGTHQELEAGICNIISAQEDGLDVTFLDTSRLEEGKETMANLVDYIVETICPRELRGACQTAAVRKAVRFALENRGDFSCDMDAIAKGLSEQDEPAALGAYGHLCSILEGEIFRKSEKKIQEGKVNILSLKGLNPKTQKRVTEIMLSVLWRKMRIYGRSKQAVTLVVDEFQNLDFRSGSVLFQMLTEIRKYGVNLVLATQTLTTFTKSELAIINQAATKLYFQPSATDMKKVADLIETGHAEKWKHHLSRLHIGEAITVGELEVGGRRVPQPIITCSEYGQEKCENKIVRREN